MDTALARKFIEAIDNGRRWTVEYDGPNKVWLIRDGIECIAEMWDKDEALALVAARNLLPQALDALDKERA